MGNIWGVGRVLLSFVPKVAFHRHPVQEAPSAGRCSTSIRMLLFGLALVLAMLFRPAGILPSAVRKRELETPAKP